MTGGETSTTSIHPSTLRASDLGTTFASDYQASSSSLPEQTQTHPAHSDYLRTALERDLNSIHQNVPRTTEAQNSKIYFDNVTREHSLAIQLQREKRRGDDLLEEVRNLKSKIRTTKEERIDNKQKLTRNIYHQQSEIAQLSGQLQDLSLSLHKSQKEKKAMQQEFSDYKRAFEKQLQQHQMTTVNTINKAEDSLTHYNDEWCRRLEEERDTWQQKMHRTEQMNEHNILSLQNQFTEAHEFYTEHIQKLRKQISKEEAARAKVEDDNEELKSELNREKAARKALTNQLKKERKWREKCISVTKGVMSLRAENEGDLKEEVTSEAANSPVNPAYQDPINLDPASLAYVQAIDDFKRTEGVAPAGHQSVASPGPNSPAAYYAKAQSQAQSIIDEERRKNKLLTLELLRQRAFASRGLGGYNDLSVNIPPSPTLNSPGLQSPYFPLGGKAAVGDREVAALRVAVERADIERVLEAEIGIEKDIELERIRHELDEERRSSKFNEGRAQELEVAVQRAVEKERSDFAQRENEEKKVFTTIIEDLKVEMRKSGTHFNAALEEERQKQATLRSSHAQLLSENAQKTQLVEMAKSEMQKSHKIMEESISEAKKQMKEQHKQEMDKYKSIMEAQIRETGEALKATRKALVGGQGVVAKVERETISPPNKTGKRASMNSIPDVQDLRIEAKND
ncbi:hypothetical protein TrVE_jg10351 [Triparma verrucosa]|uniref:Uncharacterized protein n=1 Tax=Triparma verrucosa TaxID=1606542 RepID=A0A9W7EX88_9STRA|nr:hypothetical protein TrVE_jg10351 [Triparma verrucosa]